MLLDLKVLAVLIALILVVAIKMGFRVTMHGALIFAGCFAALIIILVVIAAVDGWLHERRKGGKRRRA